MRWRHARRALLRPHLDCGARVSSKPTVRLLASGWSTRSSVGSGPAAGNRCLRGIQFAGHYIECGARGLELEGSQELEAAGIDHTWPNDEADLDEWLADYAEW